MIAQSISVFTSVNTPSVNNAPGFNTTTGNTIVIGVISAITSNVSSITDNYGNSPVLVGNNTTIITNQHITAYIFDNIIGGTNHQFTVNMTNAFDNPTVIIYNVGGRAVSSLDASNVAFAESGFTQSHPVPNITTTKTGDDIIIFSSSSNTANQYTITSPFANGSYDVTDHSYSMYSAYANNQTIGTFSPTLTTPGFDQLQYIVIALAPLVNVSIAPIIAQSISNDGSSSVTNSLSKAFANKTGAGNTIVKFGTGEYSTTPKTDLFTFDSDTNGYTKLEQQNTNPGGGKQTIDCWVAQNISGDITVPANVTQNLTSAGDTTNFQAMYLLDIGNTPNVSIIGYNGSTANNLAPGTNNITSGTITVLANQVPCILISFCMNTTGAGGSNSVPTPVAPLQLLANCWTFGGITANSGSVAYQNITTAGTYQSRYNQASSSNEDMATIAVIISGITGNFSPVFFKMYANGAMAAHSFVQATLPANTAMRLYANNTVHTANLVLNGAGIIKLYSNGTLSVNSTIII